MADLDAFRADTRSWLEANAPKSLYGLDVSEITGVWGGRNVTFAHPDQKPWLEMMADRGWTAPTWPKEYGGGGLDKAETKVLGKRESSKGDRGIVEVETKGLNQRGEEVCYFKRKVLVWKRDAGPPRQRPYGEEVWADEG